MKLICNAGHPLAGKNLYRKRRRRYCRTCRSANERARKTRERILAAKREARWLADLPYIIADAVRMA